MYNKVFRCFASATVRLYSNSVVQPLQHKYVLGQIKISVSKHAILTRGCCITRSKLVSQEFKRKSEEELNEYLRDPTNAAKFEKCKLEIEYYRSIMGRVPETLTAYNWLHLLKTDLKGQRRAYLAYLWQIEKKDENEIKKKEIRKKELEEAKKEGTSDVSYKMSFSTLFHRIREQTIMHFYNSRLMNAMLYSPTLVFDLGYSEYMTQNELMQCAKQLLFSFSENRMHDDPFNLYFCNADTNGLIMQQLYKTIPTIYDTDFPLNISSKSYLELFDKSRLVYLTPDTKTVLTSFDPNAIYIIGAMIDKTNHERLSMQKARREGIKMAKLPLAEKLKWGSGSIKTLPLNHVLNILLDLRATNNWDTALRHIPRRKLQSARTHNLMKRMKKREELISSLIQGT